MNTNTCCFSGHRKLPAQDLDCLRRKLDKTIIYLHREKGIDHFISGGALGFDLLGAERVILLRKTYPKLRLTFALPCAEHDKFWGQAGKEQFKELSQACDEVIYTSNEAYTRGCMMVRNRYLVDNASLCLCYLTETKGGTFATVNYAKKKGLEVINLGLS